jgi:hypothetical protein
MAIIHFSIFLIAYDLNAWVIMDDATQVWWVPTQYYLEKAIQSAKKALENKGNIDHIEEMWKRALSWCTRE